MIDLDFMRFAREAGCIIEFKHICRGAMTFHHVRTCGSPKDDRNGVGLCASAHLWDVGNQSIERLGKEKWQVFWDVDLETEISKLNRNFEIWMEAQV